MAEPVIERIAANIFQTVNSLRPAGANANFTYKPVRPAGSWPSPVTGLVILLQEAKPEKVDLASTPTGWVRWRWPFTLTAIVMPDEGLTVPIDTLRNEMFADLFNALLADTSRGGLAEDTLVGEPDFYAAPSGFWAVEIPVTIQFRTPYANAYGA